MVWKRTSFLNYFQVWPLSFKAALSTSFWLICPTNLPFSTMGNRRRFAWINLLAASKIFILPSIVSLVLITSELPYRYIRCLINFNSNKKFKNNVKNILSFKNIDAYNDTIYVSCYYRLKHNRVFSCMCTERYDCLRWKPRIHRILSYSLHRISPQTIVDDEDHNYCNRIYLNRSIFKNLTLGFE